MNDKIEPLVSWKNATWEGRRKTQLKLSSQKTYAERFRELEEFSATSHWLASAKKEISSLSS
jgi:hypothetical protein